MYIQTSTYIILHGKIDCMGISFQLDQLDSDLVFWHFTRDFKKEYALADKVIQTNSLSDIFLVVHFGLKWPLHACS